MDSVNVSVDGFSGVVFNVSSDFFRGIDGADFFVVGGRGGFRGRGVFPVAVGGRAV